MRLSITVLILTALFFGNSVTAQAQTSGTSTASQLQTLLNQIESLRAQIAALQAQRSSLNTELKETIQLTRQLRQGMTDEEVATLQEILAADPEVYPEGLVTGFFGPLTAQAVRKFQAKHGLEQVGEVGPRTRASLSAFVSNLNTSRALPPGLARKLLRSATSTSATSTQLVGNITICHYPSGNRAARHTIVVGAPAWQAHQKHGDTMGACDGNNTGTTTPDIIAPALSNLTATTTASTTASVSWGTNENSNSRVWYSVTTPIDANTASKVEDNSLTTSHAVNLSGLVASTTYYYLVSSTDVSLNTATSSQQMFTTPN